MSEQKKPLVLIILDGWGYREENDSNAINAAKTPNLDNLKATRPFTLISGSGMDVGLPHGQMGNSEVGHINLGSGRIVYQDFTRITKSIETGEFTENTVLNNAITTSSTGVVHIFGLLSPGGVHSHDEHIQAMIKMAHEKGAKQIYLHAFLDGRDTPPRSAEQPLQTVDALCQSLGNAKVASIVGRYYAMDRDKRWERVESAYNMLTLGEAEFNYASAEEALNAAYARDENDEFVKATTIGEFTPIQDGDSVIFMNFRADRARQLSYTFTEANFDGFERKVTPKIANYVMLTEYDASIAAPVAFPKEALNNVLGEWLQKHNKTQLHLSETEKYAHVTFFFNGGKEEPFEGEDRVLIPSPDVATYDLQPEMNAPLLTDKLVEAIEAGKHDVIICNYPNGDMVGHTGVYDAAVKACEAVDECMGRVLAALEKVDGECLITADHGNAEQMVNNATGQKHTAHTSEPVPLMYFGRDAKFLGEPASGKLSDIAPTMLYLLGMDIPDEMTGTSLLELQ